MIRDVVAAIAGYAVMLLVVLAGIGAAWSMLGAAGAFAGEGPSPSTTWMVFNVASGLVAAIAGGWMAARVGATVRAVTILIGIVLALGVVNLMLGAGPDALPIDKPVAELTFAEAGQYAVQPGWYNLMIPIVGAVGVWVGGGLAGRRGRGQTP